MAQQKMQGSAYGFSAMHANRGRQEEDSDQKNQSKHDYGRRNLVGSSKVRFNNPRRGDDATTVEDANCGVQHDERIIVFFCRHSSAPHTSRGRRPMTPIS